MEYKIGKLSVCIGLYISANIPRKQLKEELLEWTELAGRLEDEPLLDIVMPCGENMVCKTFTSVPSSDVPCSCGDSKHWFIKYKVTEKKKKWTRRTLPAKK